MSRSKMTDNMERVETFENWWASAGEEGEGSRGRGGRGGRGEEETERGREGEKAETFVLAMTL